MTTRRCWWLVAAVLAGGGCTGEITMDGTPSGPDAGGWTDDDPADDPGEEPADDYAVLDVAATRTWTDTGIAVSAGELIEIEVSGTINFRAGDAVGPDGFGPDEHDRHNELPCANHAALIGKIGADGSPFPVGSQRLVVAPAGGRLFLGVNDRDVGNNEGAFALRITTRVPHDRVGSATVSIPGDVGWIDTGIELTGDDILAVTASGIVDNYTGDERTCDPWGLPDSSNHGANILMCANHAALLGRIGAAGTPFLIGLGRSGPAPSAGRLYLGVNDEVTTDNAGKFGATVTTLRR